REFREDLFYRLNVIQIAIPPLRERREDIPALADHFVERYNEQFEREIRGLTTESLEKLSRHDWPGNVRELRNTIERAMVLEESDRIQAETLEIGSVRVEPEYGVASAVGRASLE